MTQHCAGTLIFLLFVVTLTLYVSLIQSEVVTLRLTFSELSQRDEGLSPQGAPLGMARRPLGETNICGVLTYGGI